MAAAGTEGTQGDGCPMGHLCRTAPAGLASPVGLGCHNIGGFSATVCSHMRLKFSHFQKLVEDRGRQTIGDAEQSRKLPFLGGAG